MLFRKYDNNEVSSFRYFWLFSEEKRTYMMMRMLLLVSSLVAIVVVAYDLKKVEVKEVDGRLQYSFEGLALSPWHDLPFEAGVEEGGESLLTFVCEIPLYTFEKMEIHKSFAQNPVVQDRFKDGSLRTYKYGASVVNYGAIAQTWEDPNIADVDTGLGGDNDPVDVLQLNERPCARGELQRVRVLGALALVDGGETDWKLLVVDADDAATNATRTLSDLLPARIDEVREWFRHYKTAEGKPLNKYAFDGRPVDASHVRSFLIINDAIHHRPCASQNSRRKTYIFLIFDITTGTTTGAHSSEANRPALSRRLPAGCALFFFLQRFVTFEFRWGFVHPRETMSSSDSSNDAQRG